MCSLQPQYTNQAGLDLCSMRANQRLGNSADSTVNCEENRQARNVNININRFLNLTQVAVKNLFQWQVE